MGNFRAVLRQCLGKNEIKLCFTRSPWSCELTAVMSDSGNRCIWAGEESKAGGVKPPAAGYVTISPLHGTNKATAAAVHSY